MLVANKILQRYKEDVIYFIEIYFGLGVTIVYSLANMDFYVSDIEK